MNRFFNKRIFGFTIIELMIVLIIVAILLALAYPSYLQYVRKSKRGDAQQTLMNWSVNQEIWRSNNPQYNGILNAADAGYMVPDIENYNFEPANVTSTTYILRAIAEAGNDQLNDKARDGSDCSTIWIDQTGSKQPPQCWE